MPTPKAGYYAADGKRIPGTTTVIGRFKDSGALIKWAFWQGVGQGKANDPAPDLYKKTQEAADIGTVAHALVEQHINGATEPELLANLEGMLPNKTMRDAAWSSFLAYRQWALNFKVKFLKQEIALISEKYRFGGTLDAVGEINGLSGRRGLALFDWKTSNGIYADYPIQLAAYGMLWAENFPDQPLTEGYHLLRFSKEHGDFHHHYFAALPDGERQFILFREAYDLDYKLRNRAK